MNFQFLFSRKASGLLAFPFGCENFLILFNLLVCCCRYCCCYRFSLWTWKIFSVCCQQFILILKEMWLLCDWWCRQISFWTSWIRKSFWWVFFLFVANEVIQSALSAISLIINAFLNAFDRTAFSFSPFSVRAYFPFFSHLPSSRNVLYKDWDSRQQLTLGACVCVWFIYKILATYFRGTQKVSEQKESKKKGSKDT